MKNQKSQKENSETIPAATIRGTYNTYEDRKRRDLVKALGHVVDLELEKMVNIEVGGWGTKLKLTCPKGVNITTKTQEDGSTIMWIGYV